MAVMCADLALKGKQSFWETPRAVATIVAATPTIVGVASYQAGKQASQPQVLTLQFAPGTVITVPAASNPPK